MPKATLVVLSNPVSAEKEDEYNDWYDNTHLADVVRVPGFVSAQRYRLAEVEVMPDVPFPEHRYLALYEVEGDDIAEIAQALMQRAGTPEMDLGEAIDLETTTAFFYEPLGVPALSPTA
jgi:hypothetical protein